MTDLGLRTDPRPRRRRGGLVPAIVVLLLLVGLVAGAAIGGSRLIGSFGGSAPDYPGPGTGEVTVEVVAGMSLTGIGTTLAEADVVRSAEAFTDAASADPRARSVQPGFYTLREQMSGAGALSLLLDPSSALRGRVTIPEGTPVERALAIISENTEITAEALDAALADTAALGLPAYAEGELEGYLFPATYVVDPSTTAASLLATMVERFLLEADTLRLEERAAAIGQTPGDVVKVASMIEKEAAVDGDFGKVARVAYNRLAIDMKLQFDSTLNYALEERKGNLSLDDIKTETPYNSYLTTGLPPTPISNPGTKALEAALDPTPGDWIYFVTVDLEGNAFFSKDYDEFLEAKAEGKRVRGS